jgi:hemoglobin-like flavoprotein
VTSTHSCQNCTRWVRATSPTMRPPEMYPLVGQVLLASMPELAGDAWNADLADAWSDAYGVVALAMFDGADAAQRLAA